MALRHSVTSRPSIRREPKVWMLPAGCFDGVWPGVPALLEGGAELGLALVRSPGTGWPGAGSRDLRVGPSPLFSGDPSDAADGRAEVARVDRVAVDGNRIEAGVTRAMSIEAGEASVREGASRAMPEHPDDSKLAAPEPKDVMRTPRLGRRPSSWDGRHDRHELGVRPRGAGHLGTVRGRADRSLADDPCGRENGVEGRPVSRPPSMPMTPPAKLREDRQPHAAPAP